MLSSAVFIKYQLFRKILSGITSERQTVWTQVRPNNLLGLIWVQTVCKGYQQTTLVGKELSIIWDFPFFQEHLFKSGYDELTSNETNMHMYMVLACQPRMTVTSCFVYIVIRDLYLIDHLCINPIHKIGLIHK